MNYGLIFVKGDQIYFRPASQSASCVFNVSRLPLYEHVEQLSCKTDGVEYWAVEGEPPDAGNDVQSTGLRAFFDVADGNAYALASQAIQLMHWRKTHRFCGACGKPLQRHATERAMMCWDCDLAFYPRINPVVIVRITNGHNILLARRAHGFTGFFSLIAGFVEAGETLEQAVQREVYEEVGIRVKDITYCRSQPWSFPNNLMLAFTATYDGGEISPDGQEIAEAGWFNNSNLPTIPGHISVSRWLIDDFLARDFI
jgi:NAD+ diphosphatase